MNLTSAVLKRVATRLKLASIGRRLYVAFLVLCGLYAAALLASRLLGLAPEWFGPASLGVLPLAAILLGLLFHRRPTPLETARAVDRHSGTKDLFLTMALIENSAGEYQPLVASAAEKAAQGVKPDAVVPFRVSRRLAHAVAAVLILLAGVVYVPQLDPFGKVEAREQVKNSQENLAKSVQATLLRTTQLKQDDQEGQESKEAKKAIEGLKTSFQKMKPAEKKENLQALMQEQKKLGELWRKISAEKLKELLNQTSQNQEFGATDKEKLHKWTRELQEGSTETLKKELDEMKEDLKRLAKTKDPVKKAELEQKLKKRMKELADFASDKVKSKPLSAALERAMKQLDMAKLDNLSTESLEAAEKSLDLSKMELKEIAQSAKDLKALEEALKVTQMAKRVNDEGKLDGEAAQQCESMADYAELYAQLMDGMENGDDGDGDEDGEGDGLGKRGMGRGGKAPEDDAAKTGFKTEQSKSAVTAGKVLLSLKTKGLSDRGDAKKDFRGLIQNVKQGVSEAIVQEQIPPGYYDGIKSYFDTIEQAGGKPAVDAGKAPPGR